MANEEIQEVKEEVQKLRDEEKRELKERVSNLETWQAKVDAQMEGVKSCLDRLEKGNSDIHSRLGNIEKLGYKMAGGIVLAGALFSTVPFFFN